MAQHVVLWWKFAFPNAPGSHLVRVKAPGQPNQEVLLDGQLIQAPAGEMSFTGPNASLLQLTCSPDGTWALLVDGAPAEVYQPEAIGSVAEVDAGPVAWFKFSVKGMGNHHVRVAGIGEPTQEVTLDGCPIDAPPGTMAFTGPGASYLELQRREGVWVLCVDGVVHHRQNQPATQAAADGQDRQHTWAFQVEGNTHVLTGTFIGRQGQDIVLNGVQIPAPVGTTTFTGPGGVLLELQEGAGSWVLSVNGEPVPEQASCAGAGGQASWTFFSPAGTTHQLRAYNIGRDDQQVAIDGAVIEAPPGTTTFTGPGGVLLELAKAGNSWTLLVDGVDVRDHRASSAVPSGDVGASAVAATSAASLPQGVSLDAETGKYAANIRVGGRFRFLGNFDTPEQASKAYQEAKGG